MFTNTIRVLGKSRWSRTSAGVIPAAAFRSVALGLNPRACSPSVLLIMPDVSLTLRAWTKRGTMPEASISSTGQYQLPTVSTATGEPRVHA